MAARVYRSISLSDLWPVIAAIAQPVPHAPVRQTGSADRLGHPVAVAGHRERAAVLGEQDGAAGARGDVEDRGQPGVDRDREGRAGLLLDEADDVPVVIAPGSCGGCRTGAGRCRGGARRRAAAWSRSATAPRSGRSPAPSRCAPPPRRRPGPVRDGFTGLTLLQRRPSHDVVRLVEQAAGSRMSTPLTIRFATDHAAAKAGIQDLAASMVAGMVKVSDALNIGIQANGGYAASVRTLADDLGRIGAAGVKAANDSNCSAVATATAMAQTAASTQSAAVVARGSSGRVIPSAETPARGRDAAAPARRRAGGRAAAAQARLLVGGGGLILGLGGHLVWIGAHVKKIDAHRGAGREGRPARQGGGRALRADQCLPRRPGARPQREQRAADPLGGAGADRQRPAARDPRGDAGPAAAPIVRDLPPHRARASAAKHAGRGNTGMTISGDLTRPSGVGQQVHGPHVMPAQVWELGVGAWCGSSHAA